MRPAFIIVSFQTVKPPGINTVHTAIYIRSCFCSCWTAVQSCPVPARRSKAGCHPYRAWCQTVLSVLYAASQRTCKSSHGCCILQIYETMPPFIKKRKPYLCQNFKGIMLQINFIRQNAAQVKRKAAKVRNFADVSLVDTILALDEQARKLKVESRNTRRAWMQPAKEIGMLMGKGDKTAAEAKTGSFPI